MKEIRKTILVSFLLVNGVYGQVNVASSYKVEFTKSIFYLYTEQTIINNSDSIVYFYYPSNAIQRITKNSIQLESMYDRQTPLDLNKESKCGKNLSFVMGPSPILNCSFEYTAIMPKDSLKILHRDHIRTAEQQKKGIYTLQLMLWKSDKMQNEVCGMYKQTLGSSPLDIPKHYQMNLYSYSVKFVIEYSKTDISSVSVIPLK